MKLRIKGNSVRVRLDQRDLTQLHTNGRVEDGIRFGNDPKRFFSYAIETDDALLTGPQIDYHGGHIVIRLSRSDVETWQSTDRIGFEGTQQFGETTIRLLIEKDFACLDRPQGEEKDDAFAFPNPTAGCQITPESGI